MIRTYISRYLEGESTQEELRVLKEYFRSTPDLPADLIPYAQMFAIIDEEMPTPSIEALNRFAESKVPAARRSPLWPLLAAAACIAAFALILLAPPRQKEESMAVAYVDGKILKDKALAMQIGQEALQEIFSEGGNQEQQLHELFNTP